MSNTLSKALMKSLQKAYGQYGIVGGEVNPRTYNSIYSNASANKPKPNKPKPAPYVYSYQSPNFSNKNVQQSDPNLELQQFQQAQQQLLQNQRMQQLYATTRNAGQMTRQSPTAPAPQPTAPQPTAAPTPAITPPRLSRPSNPPIATADYGESNPTSTSTPKSTTTEGFDMTKPTTSIEDKSPEPSTGASILGTTTKRHAGIRKSSKLTEHSSQYMYEGTGKVPNLPSTDRSIPRNNKYL